jgi:hypothetical protein
MKPMPTQDEENSEKAGLSNREEAGGFAVKASGSKSISDPLLIPGR